MPLITFETYQGLSFAITASLFLYMTVSYFAWFFKGLKVKKPHRAQYLTHF